MSKPSFIALYGIPNCDTVKRARKFLDDNGVAFLFHDFKKQGVPERQLDQWIEAVGWQTLVNRNGTTWRRLEDTVRESVQDAAIARRVMLANPSVIKRPVVEWPGETTVGFDAKTWPELVSRATNQSP